MTARKPLVLDATNRPVQTELSSSDLSDGPFVPNYRSTATVTAAALAAGTTANTTITIPQDCNIIAVQMSVSAWVRLYNTSAARTADASRSSNVAPVAGSGCFFDELNSGTIYLSPQPSFSNADSPAANTGYLAITNESGSQQDVTITLTYR
jgi:hypothetical protein